MDADPPTSPEYDRFTEFMDKLIRVPRSTIKRGITVHRKKSALNPNRPGPKGNRATVGASHDSAGEH